MHELALTQNLVEIAETSARRNLAQRVLSLTLVVGRLSGVEPEAVSFCFEACSQGTRLEGARLIIEAVEGAGRCGLCGFEFPLEESPQCCPSCGSWAVEILRGQELSLKEMEVE